VKLNSLAIQLFLDPECFPAHGIYNLLKSFFIEICELRLVALKEFDIGILLGSVIVK
jgi:hypothetical protein